MSLIPAELPFNLGSAEQLPEIQPWGLTSLLPTNTLPFTLSALPEFEEVPAGSVGWQIVCRSHTDFQTEIFRTSDMAPPTFSKELSGTGLASVSFDLDSYLFAKTLTNGRPVEDLFDYEHLWEIYYDKKLRFQFLGTAIKETPVDSSEVRSASVSGNGIGQVLAWASVYPKNFPDVVQKLENLKDDFSTDLLETKIWNMTMTEKGGITFSRSSQKAEIIEYIEQLTSDREGILSDYDRAQDDVEDERADYNAVYKNSSSTAAEKKTAAQELAKAYAARDKVEAKLATVNVQLADAVFKRSLAASEIPDDNAVRAKLEIKNSGDVKRLAAGMFDFQSSGISARVEPLIFAYTGGQARTSFGVYNSPNNWAIFYTAMLSGSRRLIAEVNDGGVVYTEDFAYSPTTHAFWRIREDHGIIIFDTQTLGQDTWAEKYRVADVSWTRGLVEFRYQAELSGNTGVLPPVYAYISSINSSTIPSVDTVMATYKEYLEEAQLRGTIPYVNTEFTDAADTAGATWVGMPNVEIAEGTNLLQLLQNFSQLQQFDWIMDNDFKLKVFQKVWNTEEPDPTTVFHKEDKIVLHEANAQLVRERTRDRATIGNVIVGKNSSGQYAYVENEESIDKFQRREMFIEAGNAPDLSSLGTVLQASLAQISDEKSSWRLVVDPYLPGKRIFDDYDVGDWISVESIDSTGRAKKNVWRVVGIAVQVDNNGQTIAELTLQSRLQLLAERLQQQVNNLGGSSAAGAGVTLGSSVSAATLIQQASLSNLLDVNLPPTTDRLEGDVLTWTGEYFTLTTPGDKTEPGIPEITAIESNVYYPENGTTTRAQVQVTWTTPLNTDGSTITDGHHYELRFRPDTTLPYMATWEEAGQYLWNELYTWNQPTIPPIENTGWQTLFVGFDENQTIIQELSPGVRYEFQIRAVDSSTPQHFGEWSESSLYEAAEDTIPPPQPAAPEVAASLIAVQVIHYLGKQEGGTFNLPSDMSHLEVHVGGPSFFPDETTYVGKIVADVSILRGKQPVIQTFNVQSTENVFVRVIAVDRTGNRSTPSAAAAPVTTQLIDDAHISDLTASKITAGTISSAIILSGVIKTAEDGPRAEMNYEGFRIFAEEEEAAVSLLATPGENGNYLLIKDPNDSSATLAGIDGTGRGSFQSISVSDDITIRGQDLFEDIIDPSPRGIIAIGTYSDPYVGGGLGVERGFLEISFIAEESRTYMIQAVTQYESTAANERLVMKFRDSGENDPILGPSYIQESVYSIAAPAGVNQAAQLVYAGTFSPGLHRILWSFNGQLGNATLNAPGGTSATTSLIWVEDLGIPKSDTVILNDVGVDPSGTTSPVAPPPPKPKVQYTKSYSCTWSGSYRSNGDYSSSHGSTMVQGDSGFDTWLNDARSLFGLPYSQIMKDLAGSTIVKCYLTLYANHWYYNDGGTARIGTHNYTSRPSKVSLSRCNEKRISSAGWPKPGKRRIDLGSTIAGEFRSGVTKGIILGPTDGSRRQYGRFNGNGQSNEPVLTVTYVK